MPRSSGITTGALSSPSNRRVGVPPVPGASSTISPANAARTDWRSVTLGVWPSSQKRELVLSAGIDCLLIDSVSSTCLPSSEMRWAVTWPTSTPFWRTLVSPGVTPSADEKVTVTVVPRVAIQRTPR